MKSVKNFLYIVIIVFISFFTCIDSNVHSQEIITHQNSHTLLHQHSDVNDLLLKIYKLEVNTMQHRDKAEIYANFAEKLNNKLIQWIIILLSIFTLFSSIIIYVIYKYLDIQKSEIDLLKKSTVISATSAQESAKILNSYIGQVEDLKNSLRTDNNVTDMKIDELRKKASLFLPYSHAMLASLEEDWWEAIILWKRIVRAVPGDVKAKYQLARAYNFCGHKNPLLREDLFKKAVNICQSVIQEYGDSYDVNLLIELGNSYAFLSEAVVNKNKKIDFLNKSINTYEKALRQAPDNNTALNNLAQGYFDLFMCTDRKIKVYIDNSFEYIKKSMTIKTTVFSCDTRAKILIEMAKIDPASNVTLLKEAKESIDLGIELDNSRSSIWFTYGDYFIEFFDIAPADEQSTICEKIEDVCVKASSYTRYDTKESKGVLYFIP